MNILLNLYSVQSGGGQQVASNFLQIINRESFNHKWFVYVGNDSELHELALKLIPQDQILSYKYSYLKRLLHSMDVIAFVKRNKIDIIYNYGPSIPFTKIPQVVRSVYSNLYFPEVDFWGTQPFIVRLKKRIIDHLRLKGTLAANGLIFENQAMQERSNQLFDYPIENTIYIEPSVTTFNEENVNEDYEFLTKIDNFKILYLSSWYQNKNISILPEVSSLLKKDDIKVQFILTLNPNEKGVLNHLVKRIHRLNVSEYFTFIGKIKAIHVHQVIKSSDAMILLSKLECFSSNIVEAFYFHKPLIVSDEQWAKAACVNAALYVNRDDAESIKNGIKKLVNNKELIIKLINEGSERFQEFNSPFDKVKKQVLFLEKIYEKHKKGI